MVISVITIHELDSVVGLRISCSPSTVPRADPRYRARAAFVQILCIALRALRGSGYHKFLQDNVETTVSAEECVRFAMPIQPPGCTLVAREPAVHCVLRPLYLGPIFPNE